MLLPQLSTLPMESIAIECVPLPAIRLSDCQGAAEEEAAALTGFEPRQFDPFSLMLQTLARQSDAACAGNRVKTKCCAFAPASTQFAPPSSLRCHVMANVSGAVAATLKFTVSPGAACMSTGCCVMVGKPTATACRETACGFEDRP